MCVFVKSVNGRLRSYMIVNIQMIKNIVLNAILNYIII